MARIYKLTDLVPVKIDDIKIKISPLSIGQKAEVQQAVLQGRIKGDIGEASRGIMLAMKYGIKAMEGVVDGENKPYQLRFENGVLTDECLEDLMNFQMTEKLSIVCSSLIRGIPAEFTDQNGAKLEGVEFIKADEGSDSKNA